MFWNTNRRASYSSQTFIKFSIHHRLKSIIVQLLYILRVYYSTHDGFLYIVYIELRDPGLTQAYAALIIYSCDNLTTRTLIDTGKQA